MDDKTTFATNGEIKQLDLRNPRVQAWYDAAARHSDSGRCKNDASCPGCDHLEKRRQHLRSFPGLLV